MGIVVLGPMGVHWCRMKVGVAPWREGWVLEFRGQSEAVG